MTGRQRTIAYVFIAFSLTGALFTVPTLWGKPWFVHHFYTRVFFEFALERPMLLSQLRLLESVGIGSYQGDGFRDYSLTAERRAQAMVQRNFATLQRYNRDRLTDTLSHDVMHWLLQTQVNGVPYTFHNYPVNQLYGVHKTLPAFMLHTHQIVDGRSAKQYIARIGKFEQAFAQTLETLEYRERHGIIPPRFVMQLVLDDMRAFIERPPRDHILYRHFAERTTDLVTRDVLGAEMQVRMLNQLAEQIETVVYPAYGGLINYFHIRTRIASTDAGVWKLPDGDSYYAWRLSQATSSTFDAPEIHRIGLIEVDRIQTAMKEILRAQGYSSDDFAATMRSLGQEPRFTYPDSDIGREQILRDLQALLAELNTGTGTGTGADADADADAGADIATLFASGSRVPLQVARVPQIHELTAPMSYYQAPPLDRAEPGTLYVNLHAVGDITTFALPSMVYHETIPGHHLQITRAQELDHLPYFRRFMRFPAFNEGWALYAETLADEHGLFDDPFDRLGYLSSELFHAARLVVDTGIHYYQWSRERAIDYMTKHTGLPKADIVIEIERYIVEPGLACTHKIGQLEILRLRRHARESLGEAFDLGEFHDVILGQGALPLTLLARVVDEWIASKGPPS